MAKLADKARSLWSRGSAKKGNKGNSKTPNDEATPVSKQVTATASSSPVPKATQTEMPPSPRIAVEHIDNGERARGSSGLSDRQARRSANASSATTDSSDTFNADLDIAAEVQQDLLALTSDMAAGTRVNGVKHDGSKDGVQRAAANAEAVVHAGTLPAHLYDAYLPGWVATIRRALMRSLPQESRIIAKWQHAYRSPRRDRYFVSTALLGTHSFFLIFLPVSFWLGSPYFGRGLINVLAMGVYITSALKDLVCVPRPFSPPVVRLSVGTHHLEYGFPSTHSANAVSIALYCYLWVVDYRNASALSGGQAGAGWFNSWIWELGLSYYALSVVGGRIYAGMHSITDCVAGSIMGALITLAQWWLFPAMERALIVTDWRVPAVIIPVGLAMVSFHPQPMDDCPCFEDAIAFIAVMMGVTLGRWYLVTHNLTQVNDHPFRPQAYEPYDPSALFAPLRFLPEAAASRFGKSSPITVLARHIVLGNRADTSGRLALKETSWASWSLRSLAIFVLGSIVILVVRIVVKAASKLILPPLFRLVYRAVGFALPRRFYTPAQEYESIPQDLHPIPSVLDLSSMGKAVIGGGGPFEPNRALSPSPVSASPARVASPASMQQPQQQLAFLRAASPQPYLPRASSPLARLRQPGATSTAMAEHHGAIGGSVPQRRAQFSLGGNGSASGELSLSTSSLSSLPSRSATPPAPGGTQASQQGRTQQPAQVEHPLGQLPVPLTQTGGRQVAGLDIPGEDTPDKLAEALRRGVANKEGHDARHGGRKEAQEDPIQRYDADVLTKVLTYSAIGFVASAIMPVFFEHVGLSRP